MSMLAVCHIAWPASEDQNVLPILPKMGVKGIEIAPTRVWGNWNNINEQLTDCYAKELDRLQLTCPAIQSLLYGLDGIGIFGGEDDRDLLLHHLGKVAEVAGALGAGKAVFGSPRHRDPGGLTKDAAWDIAVNFFDRAADIFRRTNTILCLEPLPTSYGCRFITNLQEAVRFTEAVDNPFLAVQLDTASLFLSEDNGVQTLKENMNLIKHIHVSEPNLGYLNNPLAPHQEIAEVIENAGWNDWISIEMAPKNFTLDNLESSIHNVTSLYKGLLEN